MKGFRVPFGVCNVYVVIDSVCRLDSPTKDDISYTKKQEEEVIQRAISTWNIEELFLGTEVEDE